MLKSFDFFRKIQTDQELTSATGGIFTFIAIIVNTLPNIDRNFINLHVTHRFLPIKILHFSQHQKR